MTFKFYRSESYLWIITLCVLFIGLSSESTIITIIGFSIGIAAIIARFTGDYERIDKESDIKDKHEKDVEDFKRQAEWYDSKRLSDNASFAHNIDEINYNLLREKLKNLVNENKLTDLQNTLLEKLVTEMNLQNITPEQCYLIVKGFNPTANTEITFFQHKEFIEAELDKMKQETRALKTKSDEAQWKFERKKKIDEV